MPVADNVLAHLRFLTNGPARGEPEIIDLIRVNRPDRPTVPWSRVHPSRGDWNPRSGTTCINDCHGCHTVECVNLAGRAVVRVGASIGLRGHFVPSPRIGVGRTALRVNSAAITQSSHHHLRARLEPLPPVDGRPPFELSLLNSIRCCPTTPIGGEGADDGSVRGTGAGPHQRLAGH